MTNRFISLTLLASIFYTSLPSFAADEDYQRTQRGLFSDSDSDEESEKTATAPKAREKKEEASTGEEGTAKKVLKGVALVGVGAVGGAGAMAYDLAKKAADPFGLQKRMSEEHAQLEERIRQLESEKRVQQTVNINNSGSGVSITGFGKAQTDNK